MLASVIFLVLALGFWPPHRRLAAEPAKPSQRGHNAQPDAIAGHELLVA